MVLRIFGNYASVDKASHPSRHTFITLQREPQNSHRYWIFPERNAISLRLHSFLYCRRLLVHSPIFGCLLCASEFPVYVLNCVFPVALWPDSWVSASTSLSHSDTSHSVGLLWMSDQPDAETSSWQHTTSQEQTPTPPAEFEPAFPVS
jgi:hypothetical protein